MSYIMTAERIGMEKGLQQGMDPGRYQGLLKATRLGLGPKPGSQGVIINLVRSSYENH